MVIDLAVEDGPDSSVFIRHRLRSRRGQVDDTEAGVD